nr:hypothetical protein CFP56_70897 [Quercus suber]
MGSSRKACGDCVLRNSASDWILGFIRNLGTTSCTNAELWILKDDLILALQSEFNNINAKFDAEVLVYMFTNPSTVNNILEPLLSDCRNLLRTLPS